MKLIRLLSLIVPMLFLAAPPAQAHFERAELEQMLAPIALYPDSVLSHVLIAATYPDQVADAAHWSRRHPDLQGEAAVDAVERFDWDPSVKALVAFPEVLARMDEDPDWTDQLGEAFLDQEGEVMDAVQHLRTRAYEAGRLNELDNVRVVREREYIYIEPAVHGVIFVPYYDPWWVYGSWWWPHYPPYCWTTWYGRPVRYYGSSWYWGVGFQVRPAFYFTTFHWPARHVVVTHRHDRPLYSGRDVQRHQEVRHWRQEPAARRHAERPQGVDRRQDRRDERPENQRRDRREERGDQRRDEPRDERRNERPRPEQRNEGRRGQRPDDRDDRTAPAKPERDDTPDERRRERMERGRQQRDAGRERSSGPEGSRGRGSRERDERSAGADPGPGEAAGRSQRVRPEADEPRGRRAEARADPRADREETQGRREDVQSRRAEGPDRQEAAPAQRPEREQHDESPRSQRPEARGERAQGRQNRERGERERPQREDRSRR